MSIAGCSCDGAKTVTLREAQRLRGQNWGRSNRSCHCDGSKTVTLREAHRFRGQSWGRGIGVGVCSRFVLSFCPGITTETLDTRGGWEHQGLEYWSHYDSSSAVETETKSVFCIFTYFYSSVLSWTQKMLLPDFFLIYILFLYNQLSN